MIALILAHLRALSPSYRASRLALKIERNRRIGYARFHARKLMLRAAMVEQDEWKTWAVCSCTDAEYLGAVATPSLNLAGEWEDVHGSDYKVRGPGYLPATVWRALPLFGRTFRGL